MIRIFRGTCLIVFTAPAMACDLDGSTVTGEPVPGGADLYVQNNLALSRAPGAVCVLQFDFGQVGVEWTHGAGDDPDAMRVTPPAGWVADPPDAIIPEGGAVRVKVRGGLLG
jgi:hypothetical protein